MSEIDLGNVRGKDSIYKHNVSGTSGSMEYSNGIKECWGYATVSSGKGYIDLELPIQYSDNNFNPMITGYQSGGHKLFVQYVTNHNIRVSTDTVVNEDVHFYYRCIGR